MPETPLREEHLRLGAKLTNFGGWDMPLQYSGTLAEHAAVRERAGLFDVSHLGKLIVTESSLGALDRLLPGKVLALPIWRAGYNLVLNDDCGIVDDIFVYRHPDYTLVVPNASNTDQVASALTEGGVSVTDARDRWAILALSGPLARDIGRDIVEGLEEIKMHTFVETKFGGEVVLAARTGYTGEYTLEFFVPHRTALDLWRSLLEIGKDRGLVSAGLGARDTLRLEMGYPLHGHEIDTTTNPIESGLSWVIEWDKESEHRMDLKRCRGAPQKRSLVGLIARGREIPRQGYGVFRGDERVGEVTSGNFSPVIRRGIAMAYVSTEVSAPGTMLQVDVRGRKADMEVTKPPFIRR